MPPTAKYTKEEIINAAVEIAREKGIEAVTARELAARLNVSTRPVFTYFETIEDVKKEVRKTAREIYGQYIEKGLKNPVPFLGTGMEYINFAKNEKMLYKALFLSFDSSSQENSLEGRQFMEDMVVPTLMRVYKMEDEAAVKYFRYMWTIAHSLAVLIVAGGASYTDKELAEVFGDMSLAICKSIKEIDGFASGEYDRAKTFKETIGYE